MRVPRAQPNLAFASRWSKYQLSWQFLGPFPRFSWFSKYGFSKLREKSFHFQCESWSEVDWALRESPEGAVGSCKDIKMVKIATFLTSSPTFPGTFLVWKSGFWKLCEKSFHFQCKSWSGMNGACLQSPRRAEGSGFLTLPWRVLNFSRIDQPSTSLAIYVPQNWWNWPGFFQIARESPKLSYKFTQRVVVCLYPRKLLTNKFP